MWIFLTFLCQKLGHRSPQNLTRQLTTEDFAHGTTWCVMVNNLPTSCISICSIMWKHDVIHKTGSNNILHCHLRRTKPQPKVTCKGNFVKFGHVVFEIWRLTDRQTDMKITILCTPFHRPSSQLLLPKDYRNSSQRLADTMTLRSTCR